MHLSLLLRPHSPLILPLNYQQMLQGFIYRIMQDREFASFLHERGYEYGKRTFKLFTFSRLTGKAQIDRRTKTICFRDTVRWQVSSVLPEFIQEFGRSLLLSPELEWHGQKLSVEELRYKQEEHYPSCCEIVMLSPVTVHSTYETYDGRKLTRYFDPDAPDFAQLIHDNLRRKYVAYYGSEPESKRFTIRPVRVRARDKVVTQFKNIIITGWNGRYMLEAPAELIRFAHAVGIGSRNSQGFGMFKIYQKGKMVNPHDKTGTEQKQDQ